VGHAASIQTLDYGETVTLDGVKLSFHPAGHVLGSAQVRLEYGGEARACACPVSGSRRRTRCCLPSEISPVSQTWFPALLTVFSWIPAAA
jgi:putative mRNA 3-end processing factor